MTDQTEETAGEGMRAVEGVALVCVVVGLLGIYFLWNGSYHQGTADGSLSECNAMGNYQCHLTGDFQGEIQLGLVLSGAALFDLVALIIKPEHRLASR
jgi:hypothetical protein